MAERLNEEQLRHMVGQIESRMGDLAEFRNSAALSPDSGVQANLHRLGIARTVLLAALGEVDLDIALEPDEMYDKSSRVLRFRPLGEAIEEPDTRAIFLEREINS